MSYAFECPECENHTFERLGSSGEGETAEAHCWSCDYNGEVGEASDYEESPDLPF